MGWTTRGKVNVTLNSAVVTGVGSLFLQDGRIGDGFRGPDGRIYEVTNIATNTGLTIQPPYEGPTVNNATYFLAPFEGYVKDTADALRAASLQIGMLPASKQDKSENLTLLSGLTSAVDKLPFFAGVGVMSLTALTAKARAFLGLTDEAAMRAWLQLVKITSLTDQAADRVITTGFQGLGGPGVVMANWTEDFKKGSGFFQANAAAPGGPGPAGYSTTGVNLTLNAGPIGGQIAVFNGDNRMVFRSAYNAFLPWCEVVHSLNAQMDPAVNAGGLMFYGANANGEFWKYACGMLVCKVRRTFNIALTYQSNGIYVENCPEWVFPVSFVGDLPMITQNTGVPGYATIEGANIPSNGYVQGSLYSMAAIPSTLCYQGLMAVGRWK